jgi:hypothetical protein
MLASALAWSRLVIAGLTGDFFGVMSSIVSFVSRLGFFARGAGLDFRAVISTRY